MVEMNKKIGNLNGEINTFIFSTLSKSTLSDKLLNGHNNIMEVAERQVSKLEDLQKSSSLDRSEEKKSGKISITSET